MASRIKVTFVFNPVMDKFIVKALDTLHKHTPEEHRVIVIDQTVNGIYSLIKDKIDLYLRFKRTNQGFAKSLNEGIIHGLNWGSQYVAVCNDDIELLDDRYFSGIESQFTEYPKMMAVNPASVIEPGWGYGIDQSNFECPNWGIAVGKNIYPKKPDGKPFTYEDAITKEGYDWLVNGYKQGHIEGFAGWFVVGKREMWENVGLYDEKFYPGGGEDYDLNHRIYMAGGRASATMRSWVWHHWSKSREALRDGERLPNLSRPSFQNVNSFYEHSAKGATSPIFPPRDKEPFGNRRKRKSSGIFIDDPR